MKLGDYIMGVPLSTDLVKSIPFCEGVVGLGGEFKEFTDMNNFDKKQSKPVINIVVKGKLYSWPLSKKVADKLCIEFDSEDTDDWVNGVVFLSVKKRGSVEWIVPTVKIKPLKRSL